MDGIDTENLDLDRLYLVIRELYDEGEISFLPERKLVCDIYETWGFDILMQCLEDEEILEFIKFSTVVHWYSPDCSVEVYDAWLELYNSTGYHELMDRHRDTTALH